MTTNNPIPPSQSNSQPFSFDDAGVVKFYQGPVIVDDNLTVQGNLTVDGTIDGGTVVYDDVTVSGTLIVDGGATFANVTVSGTLITDDATVSGALTVGNVTVSGTLTVDDATVSGALTVGDVTVSSTLTVENGVAVTGEGLVVGSPTSGNLGTGTINAEAIYVDDVPVLTSLGSYATLPATTISNFTVTNTSAEMCGVGATWTITPAKSGKILVTMQAYITSSSAANTFSYQLYAGTGTAPAHGAAVTGTPFGHELQAETSGGAVPIPILIVMILTGFTVDTTYWFDLAGSAGNATDTMNVEGITVSLGEMP